MRRRRFLLTLSTHSRRYLWSSRWKAKGGGTTGNRWCARKNKNESIGLVNWIVRLLIYNQHLIQIIFFYWFDRCLPWKNVTLAFEWNYHVVKLFISLCNLFVLCENDNGANPEQRQNLVGIRLPRNEQSPSFCLWWPPSVCSNTLISPLWCHRGNQFLSQGLGSSLLDRLLLVGPSKTRKGPTTQQAAVNTGLSALLPKDQDAFFFFFLGLSCDTGMKHKRPWLV